MSDLQQEVRLSAGDEPTLASYRPVSRLAVLALALAVASPLALAAPLLWVLPAAAIAASVVALLVVSRPDASVIGRKAALAALAGACFFGAWAPARHLSWQATIDRQSQQFIENWFELIRSGRLEEAYLLHADSRSAPPPDEGMLGPGMEAPPAEEDPLSASERFFQTPPHNHLRRALQNGSVRHESLAAVSSLPQLQRIYQRFVYDDQELGQRVYIRIAAQMALNPYEGQPRWMIYSVDTEAAPL